MSLGRHFTEHYVMKSHGNRQVGTARNFEVRIREVECTPKSYFALDSFLHDQKQLNIAHSKENAFPKAKCLASIVTTSKVFNTERVTQRRNDDCTHAVTLYVSSRGSSLWTRLAVGPCSATDHTEDARTERTPETKPIHTKTQRSFISSARVPA